MSKKKHDVPEELLAGLLANYKNPEDLIGEEGLLKHLTKLVVERALEADPSLLRTQCYLNGEWQDADKGGTFAVVNPATGTTIAHVPQMGQLETRRAIHQLQQQLSP